MNSGTAGLSLNRSSFSRARLANRTAIDVGRRVSVSSYGSQAAHSALGTGDVTDWTAFKQVTGHWSARQLAVTGGHWGTGVPDQGRHCKALIYKTQL